MTIKLKKTVKMNPVIFGIIVKDKYWGPKDCKILNTLLLFFKSYLCESGFSRIINIKTKKHKKLRNLEEKIEMALSFISTNIAKKIYMKLCVSFRYYFTVSV